MLSYEGEEALKDRNKIKPSSPSLKKPLIDPHLLAPDLELFASKL